ncbi:MAG: hypothetical protein OEU92_22305 [Alphaproteobacteria bacterium]|nr:hypothetical protein [Alphaproteobacteria bacterium]
MPAWDAMPRDAEHLKEMLPERDRPDGKADVVDERWSDMTSIEQIKDDREGEKEDR